MGSLFALDVLQIHNPLGFVANQDVLPLLLQTYPIFLVLSSLLLRIFLFLLVLLAIHLLVLSPTIVVHIANSTCYTQLRIVDFALDSLLLSDRSRSDIGILYDIDILSFSPASPLLPLESPFYHSSSGILPRLSFSLDSILSFLYPSLFSLSPSPGV